MSVDGIEIVASLVLLAHRRPGTRAGWLPWAALMTGTAASVAANVAVGAADSVGRLVAGWPAVALLVAIKLLAGLLDARSHDPLVPTAAGACRSWSPRFSAPEIIAREIVEDLTAAFAEFEAVAAALEAASPSGSSMFDE